MAGTRANKIQRYKEQKELQKKLTELRDRVELEHVDDEVRVGNNIFIYLIESSKVMKSTFKKIFQIKVITLKLDVFE